MAMPDHDPPLDAALRNVPPPADAARLASAETVFSDHALDAMLADIAAPAGLVDRLLAAVARPDTSHRGGVIDLDRISRPPRSTERRRSRIRRWGMVLTRDGFAVAMALSAAWGLFAVGHALSRRLASPADHDRAVVATSRPAREPERSVTVTAPEGPAATDVASVPEPLDPPSDPPHVAPTRSSPTSASPDVHAVAEASRTAAPSVRGAPVGAAVTAPSATAGISASRLGEPPREAWRAVPRVRGFDLAFEMAHGEPPFADPSIAGLSSDTPPLSLGTTSFDRLAASVASWKSPVRGFRMEDVIAAIPPPVAPTAISAGDAIDLRVLGVRSLRRVAGRTSLLVEIAATTGELALRRGEREPLDVTLVIDRSAGCDPTVWPWLCSSVVAVARAMSPDDRLSIVVAGPVPRLAIRRGDAAAVAGAAADLVRLPPTDVADLDAAVRLAPPNGPLVVMAHRDTAERARDEARAALATWHETQAATGGESLAADRDPARPQIAFVLVDAAANLGQPAGEPWFGSTAAEPAAIRREALRRVFAADRLVARQCRLTVSFDPASVASWRLVGHRQSVVESLSTAETSPLDLHAGETIRSVYEVVPRGPAAPAVEAVLHWRAAANDRARRTRAVLDADAGDITASLPSPHGCELVLAVAVAEAAGGSVHAEPAATTAAADLARRWRDRGDVSGFGAVLATCLERHAGGRRPPR
ncbi:MAG: hypothetical protein ACKOC8_10130 [Pirellulales bacterium]